MTITTQRVTCSDCEAVSDVEMVMDAPVSVVMASMEAARCPKCGGGNLGLGGAHGDAPPLTAPIAQRASWWIRRGAVGTSSGTIYSVLAQAALPHRRADVPHDPDDFSRCKALLDLIPEWREFLPQVGAKYKAWRPFVDNWAKLEEMFTEEAPSGTAPKMYEFMRTLRKGAA